MDEWWKAVLLGFVEGLTEFLPISSTGHLLVIADMLRFDGSVGGTFEIFIQLGAVLAVLGFYARDLLSQALALPRDPSTRRFWLGVAIAFVPAAVIGLALHDWIKRVLFVSPTVIAWSLIVGGLIFLVVERLPQRPVTTSDVTQISLRQAFGIGVAQVCALVPGVSRSGATIIGGMLAGLDRQSATSFSFYLALPTLGAATLVDLYGSLDQLAPEDLVRLIVGTTISLIVAWASIGWLLRYVARHTFVPFGLYRIAAGVLILALVQLRLL
jgi:undecaprenyl-diphosphatase